MRNLRPCLVGVLLLASSGCSALLAPVGREVPRLPGNSRVLFIGNSHTYTNDLPGMVQALARAAGDTALRTTSITSGGVSLEDHMAMGDAPRALQQSAWEFVVLQQGTSAANESQLHLSAWAGQFEPLIRGAGAVPVLYQIWPHVTRRFDADAAVTSYYNAAVAVEGIFAPAGDAFTDALGLDAGIGVYSPDGLHASRRGTYLAAVVILSRLTGVDPETLPATIPGASEDAAVVRQLQRAAAMALARHPARPTEPR